MLHETISRRTKACELRKKGLSYGEILSQISASKSSISLWCKDIEIEEKQKTLLKKRGGIASQRGIRNKQTRALEIKKIKACAKQEILPLTPNEFKIAGLMLYLAEGAKSRLVDFANANPETIVFMMKWLRDICKVPDRQFRLQLHIHSGQNEEEMKLFWSKLINLPLQQFHKTYVKPEGTGHRKNRLYYGTIKIRICDRNLLHKILGWVEGVVQQHSDGPLAQLVEQVT